MNRFKNFLSICNLKLGFVLAILLAILVSVVPAAARNIPFPTEHNVDTNFYGAWSVLAIDVDGDSDMDVLGAAYHDNDITWWENTSGDGSVWSEHSIDADFSGAKSVYAADVDGDGDMDVLGAAQNASDIAWWENTAGDGSNWTKHNVDTSFNGANSVYAVDMDGDGDLDVLGAADVDDDIAWWENTAGDGSNWTKHNVDTSFDGVNCIYAADVDGDGDPDVLGSARFDNAITWWENTAGDGSTWSEHSVDSAFGEARSVYAIDMDKDGDIDVLGAAEGDNAIAWWENTAGDGSNWTKHNVDTNVDRAASAYAADLDGDGDLDVLGAAERADYVAWWENTDGDGTSWTQHNVDTSFDGAISVYAADMNGDGDLDFLGAAWADKDIVWWENRGGQFALDTSNTAPANMNAGSMDDILLIKITHEGRSGDSNLELVTLELLFKGCYGSGCTAVNLTSAQGNELFDDLRIYLDTGNGTFESGADTLVATIDPLALTAGVQTITFTDGDSNVQVDYGTPQIYFVVVDRVDNRPASPTVDRFTITHVTESSSTAEDRPYDIGLILEYVANRTSGLVITLGPTAISLSNFSAKVSEDNLIFFALVSVIGILAGSWVFLQGKAK